MREFPRWRLGVVAALAVAVVGFSGTIVGSATGQPAGGHARPSAVAVVSISKVLENLDERTDKEGELSKMGRERESAVMALSDKAKVAMADLDVLPKGTADWKAKREEALRLEATFRLEKQIAELTLGEQQKAMQLALFNKIVAAVKAYAEREGFDLVVTNDSNATIPDDLPDQQFMAAVTGRRIVYASEEIDITDEVTLAMNNEYKAPGP